MKWKSIETAEIPGLEGRTLEIGLPTSPLGGAAARIDGTETVQVRGHRREYELPGTDAGDGRPVTIRFHRWDPASRVHVGDGEVQVVESFGIDDAFFCLAVPVLIMVTGGVVGAFMGLLGWIVNYTVWQRARASTGRAGRFVAVIISSAVVALLWLAVASLVLEAIRS